MILLLVSENTAYCHYLLNALQMSFKEKKNENGVHSEVEEESGRTREGDVWKVGCDILLSARFPFHT